MPRDTNGNTQPLPGTIVSTGDTILPSQHNPMVQDVYAMMTQSLSRDGQGGMRAPLNMSGFVVRNVGEATSSTDAVPLGQSLLNGTPIGSILDYTGSSAPDKWMFPYGQALSRASYPEIFSVIGTTYGAGDGATTFNLPDCRGFVIAGKDNMGGVASGRLFNYFGAIANTIGGAFGQAFHVLTTGQMPRHSHSVTDPSHTHAIPYQGVDNTNGTAAFRTVANVQGFTAVQSSLTGVSIQQTGGDEAHNNTQPTLVMNKIIKVSN